MANTYIFEVDQFTEEDAQLGKQFDETDRIVFMPNENGMIPYMLVPAIMSWKVSPVFLEPTEGPADEIALAFLLGLQSSGCDGSLNICMENNPFQALDECSFETDKGMATIHCCSSLQEAFERSDVNVEEREEEPEPDEKPIFTKKQDVSYGIGKEDESSFAQAPKSFVKKIEELQGETDLDLLGHVNALYECVKNAPEGVQPALNFQLGMRFKEEVVPELSDLLSEYDTELKAAI